MELLVVRFTISSLLCVYVLAGANAGARQLAPDDCVCTLDIRPVCTSIGVTFDNSCLAACVGATVTDNGPCTDDDLAAPGPINPECVCTLDIRPVCGADGQTYENTCLALCQGATIVSLGSCVDTSASPLPTTTPSTNELCVCTLDIRPVCGTDGQTYENACLAQCAGLAIVNLGPCNGTSTTPAPPVCDCTLDIRPVCGADGETYDNACLAGCEGITIIALGPCSELPSTVTPASTMSTSPLTPTPTTTASSSGTPSVTSISTASNVPTVSTTNTPSTETSPLVSSTTTNPASGTTPSFSSSTSIGSPLTSVSPTTAVSAPSSVTASSSGTTSTTSSTGATSSAGSTASTLSPRTSTTYSSVSSYLNSYNVSVQPSGTVGSSTIGPTSGGTFTSSSATTSYHIHSGTRMSYSFLSKL